MKMFNKRVLFMVLAVVALLGLLAGVSVVSGFTEDVRTAYKVWTLPTTDRLNLGRDGSYSLEERILGADLIAVVSLRSTTRGVVKQKRTSISGDYSKTGYTQALEFHFDVHQYLKGKGPERITGLVPHLGWLYRTTPGAMLGKTPDPDRKTRWDNRRAVVFLRDDGKDPDRDWRKGLYWLAVTTDDDDLYSINNPWRNPWLPAVSESDEQTFLLEQDLTENSPRTISLDDLKRQVSFMEQKLAGQTEEYRDCLYYQYQWQRKVQSRGEQQNLPGIRYHLVWHACGLAFLHQRDSPI